MKKISIHIVSRDRHSEISLLLQSLRTQTFQNFNLVIIDESQSPLAQNHFFNCVLKLIKYEGHHVNIVKNDLRLGVTHARNMALEKDYFKNEYSARIDDDCVLEPDYLEKLMSVIEEGYDIASGVTPAILSQPLEREIKFVLPIINEKKFDKEGNITKYGDDCGVLYREEAIIPAHEFRSCALFKKEVFEKLGKKPYPECLSKTGFREEMHLSAKAILAGFTIGVHTQAVAHHILTPSGGCRWDNYQENVKSDHEYFQRWLKEKFKEHGDFFEEYNKKVLKCISKTPTLK